MNNAAELLRKLCVKEYSLVVAINAKPDILARIREVLPEGATLLAAWFMLITLNIIIEMEGAKARMQNQR